MEREDNVLKKIFAATIIPLQSLVIAILLSACNYGFPIFSYGGTGVEDRAKTAAELSGDQLPALPNGGKYSFIVLSDSHFGSTKSDRAEERFLKTFKELLQTPDQSLRPRFIVNLGDTLDGGRSGEADSFNAVRATWIEAGKAALGTSDYKVYSILGNHDLYNDGWDVWKKKIYPYTSFYKFTLNSGGAANGGFDFLFLDSGNGTLGGPQIEDLEKKLRSSARPKIILTHYPIYAGGIFYFALGDTEERARLISDFAGGNVKYIFEGHYHPYRDFDFGPFKEADVGAYLEKKKFGLVTVDETTASVSFTRMGY